MTKKTAICTLFSSDHPLCLLSVLPFSHTGCTFYLILSFFGLAWSSHFTSMWFGSFFSNSVWTEAQLHPAALLPPLLLIETILPPVWMMLIRAHLHINCRFNISPPCADCFLGELQFDNGPQFLPAAASAPLQLPGWRWPNQSGHDTGHTGHESPAGRLGATSPVRTLLSS